MFPHVLEIGIIFLNSMSKIMPVGLAESELYIFEGKGRTHVAFHSRIYTRQPWLNRSSTVKKHREP